MERRHLSRPVYEGLPWFYMGFGLLALLASYLLAAQHGSVSLAVGVLGLVSLVYGMVVMLRRRDYRAMRSRYGNPDSLGDDESSPP